MARKPQRLQPQLQPPLPSLLQRLWRNAWSDVWGFITVAAGILSTGFSYIGSIVSDPSVKDTLNELKLPAYVGLAIAVIGAVTVISAEHPAGDS